MSPLNESIYPPLPSVTSRQFSRQSVAIGALSRSNYVNPDTNRDIMSRLRRPEQASLRYRSYVPFGA